MKIILSDDEACNFAKTLISNRIGGVEPITVELDCPTVPESVYSTFSLNVPMPANALRFLMSGDWIAAIKEVRATYGWGLKETKDYVCYYRDLNKKP